MPDRYDDITHRDRDPNRDRGRDAGERSEEYRRESRGEHDGRAGRDYDDYAREADYSRERIPETHPSETRHAGRRTSEANDWRSRDRGYEPRQDVGGGMGAYSGSAWRTEQYRSVGGGMGEGFRPQSESWNTDRGYGERRGTYGGNTGTAGRYIGRGPKRYHRPDERIREDVCERLTEHPDIDASEVEIQVNNGEVTLAGSVDDRHQKRLAEDVIENLWGVRDVHNHLRVSTGLGQRMGEALGLRDEREDERNRTSSPTASRQAEPAASRR
jgi:osmotically-inducible protein OsmY